MFGAFNERMDSKSRRRLVVSVAVSIVLYAGLAAIAVAIASGDDEKPPEEREVEVTFVRKIEEPPPPPPPPAPKPLAPGPVNPAPPSQPPPAKPPTPALRREAPKAIPKAKPAEADPQPAKSERVVDPLPANNAGTAPTGPTDPNGGDGPGGNGKPGDPLGGGGGGGDTPGGSVPVILPAGATAPIRLSALVTDDDYPRSARAANIEGVVKVKVVVKVDGSVELVKFIQSDENFDAAVRSILKRLKYKPAVYNGQPIAVFQNLTFPFEIN